MLSGMPNRKPPRLPKLSTKGSVPTINAATVSKMSLISRLRGSKAICHDWKSWMCETWSEWRVTHLDIRHCNKSKHSGVRSHRDLVRHKDGTDQNATDTAAHIDHHHTDPSSLIFKVGADVVLNANRENHLKQINNRNTAHIAHE
jgi:hypothetical protein